MNNQIVIQTPDTLLAKFVECATEDRAGPFTDAFWRLILTCKNHMERGNCRAYIWSTEREPDDIYFHIEAEPLADKQGTGRRLLAGCLHYHRHDKTWGIHT